MPEDKPKEGQKEKLFKRRDVVFAIGYSMLAAAGFTFGLSLKPEKRAPAPVVEDPGIPEEIRKTLDKMYTKDSLHKYDCPFGKVTGRQERVLAEAIKEISLSDGKRTVSTAGGADSFLRHDGSAAPIIEKYLDSEMVPVPKSDAFRTREYALKIVSAKTINDVDIEARIARQRGAVYVRDRDIEFDKASNGKFCFDTTFPLTLERQGVEEIVIRLTERDQSHTKTQLIDHETGGYEGDPGCVTAALFRVPIVVNTLDPALYITAFSPSGMRIIDLKGKPITKPFSVRMDLPGFGFSETYHVQNPSGEYCEIPLRLQKAAQDGGIEPFHYTPVNITITQYDRAEGPISKSSTSLVRELIAVPSKEKNAVLIDPYDIQKNSAHHRYRSHPSWWDKPFTQNRKDITRHVLRGLHTGDTLKERILRSPDDVFLFEIKGMNAAENAVDLLVQHELLNGESVTVLSAKNISLRGNKEARYSYKVVSIDCFGKDADGKEYVDLVIDEK